MGLLTLLLEQSARSSHVSVGVSDHLVRRFSLTHKHSAKEESGALCEALEMSRGGL